SGRRRGQCDGVPGAWLTSVAFLSGNKVLAAGITGQTVRLWEVPSGREWTPRGGHRFPVTTLAFSRDGKTLLSGGADGVRLWEAGGRGKDPAQCAPRRSEREAPFGEIACLLSPDGRYVVWGGRLGQGLRAVDMASGEEVAELEGFLDQEGMPAAFAADGAAF